MADAFNEVFSKEEFWSMAPPEQRKVLAGRNEAFAGLPEIEQNKVIGKRHLHYLKGPEFKERHPASAGVQKGLWDQIKYHTKTGVDTIVSDAPKMAEGIGQQVSMVGNLMSVPFTKNKAAALAPAVEMGAAERQRMAQDRRTADERWKEGNYSEALGHKAAGVLPMTGQASEAGEEIRRGEYGKGMAHAFELLAPSAMHLLPEGVKLPKALRIKNQHNPVEQAAIESLEPHVQQSTGQRSGSEVLQRREQGLKNLPGSARRAQSFYREQEEQIAERGRTLAAKASPTRTNEVGAGEEVHGRLRQRIVRLKDHADRLYGDVRGETAKNQVTVSTGSTASKIIDPTTNKPVATATTATFESPVELAPIKSSLGKIYDDLKANMRQVQRENSPAFGALEQLMKSDQTHMSAMDFDKFLGAVKSIARDGKSPYLTSASQALAKRVIAEGEVGLNKALLQAGKDVPAKLKTARTAVRSYYETGEMLSDLPEEPKGLYDKLSKGGERNINTLRTLNKVAPKELKVIGRTYLEGLIEKATKDGGFGRAAGVKEDWRSMGPETKQMLFGPELTKELDNFMLGSKKLLENLNKSGTTHSALAMGGLGAVGTVGLAVLQGFLTGDWARAAEVGGGVALTGVALPNIMARILFSEGGAKLLTGLSKIPVRTPAFQSALVALGGRITAASKKPEAQDQDDQNTPAEAATDNPSPTVTPSPVAEKTSPSEDSASSNFEKYSPVASDAADTYGIPRNLFLWQIQRESGWNPKAANIGPNTHARGIAQFQPGTAREQGIDPANPEESLYAAAAYMRKLYDQTGDWSEALRRYGTINENSPANVLSQVDSIISQSDDDGV